MAKNQTELDGNRFVPISTFGLIFIFIIVGLLPVDSLWGFNHLQYFPLELKAILILAVFLILIPDISAKITALFGGLRTYYRKFPRPIQIVALVISSAFFFYLLRVHVHSLGDGYQRIFEIETSRTLNPAEPLDFFLHVILYRGISFFTDVSAESIYICFSIACGVIFSILLYFFKFPESNDSTTSASVKLMIFGFGGLQLFFGYVESYSLFYMSALLYTLWSYRFMVDGRGLIQVSILFAISLLAHNSGLILLPSFLYVLYHAFKTSSPDRRPGKFLALAIALAAIGIFAVIYIASRNDLPAYQSDFSRVVLPIFAKDAYSILSLRHIYDVANEIVLIAPIALLIILHILISRNSGSIDSKIRLFLILSILFPFLFIGIVDPKLGFARDWDLFSTPLAVSGTIIILAAYAGGFLKRLSHYHISVLIIASFIFSGSWILMNSSDRRQLSRAEILLSSDRRAAGYGTELLAQYYLSDKVNRPEKALKLLNGIKGIERNARVLDGISKTEFRLGHYRSSLITAREGISLDSLRTDLYLMAGASYIKLSRYDSALAYLNQAKDLKPGAFGNYGIYLNLAEAYYGLDSLDMAIQTVKKAIGLEPKMADGYFLAGLIYIAGNNLDTASALMRTAMKINPKFPGSRKYIDSLNIALRKTQDKQ